jgi:hypothetical protein
MAEVGNINPTIPVKPVTGERLPERRPKPRTPPEETPKRERGPDDDEAPIVDDYA